jgi:guanylate kinase
MDSQFDTLSRSYHDNYIEYATTGNKSYKTSYEAAEKGLKSIVNSLKSQVDKNAQNIKDVVGGNAKTLFAEKQAALKSIGLGIHTEKDRVVEAQMRLPPPPPPVSYQTQYIMIVGLLATIALMPFF